MNTIARSQSGLEVGEQVEDLRLDRHVERADRLVEHEDLRVERERAGDADALALPAGELVRVAGRVLGAEADELEQLGDASRDVAAPARDRSGSATAAARSTARVERGVGILEHDLHAVSKRAERAARGVRDVVVVDADRAGGGLEQAHEQAGDRRLPAARLADEAERLAAGAG